MEVSLYEVFIYSLITAIATGLGALPFAFAKKMPKSWLGYWTTIAAALMLAASFGMIYEGIEYSLYGVFAWIIVGLLFILFSDNFLKKQNVSIGDISWASAHKILLIMWVMTLHSFAEWVAVWVSFGPSLWFGLFIALAIAIQNIPEGLAISLVMVPRGVKRWKAALWSIFSSLPQPLMAIPAFIFVQYFEPVLPFGLGFAAGAMIWMSFSELIPEAVAETPKEVLASIATVAIWLMVVFQQLVG